MHIGWELIGLEDLGAVRLRGPDVVSFLQGQVSNDVARLTAEHSLLAGYHNPQGRTIAVLRLVQLDPHDILALVARDLAATVASRLSRFVLRAKVRIEEESAHWRVSGLVASGPGSVGAGLPSQANAQARFDGCVFIRVDDSAAARWLVACPADRAPPVPGSVSAAGSDCTSTSQPAANWPVGDPETWQRLEIAAGQPQVYASTSEEFVAQMLNLDVLGAITFDKGCYTGQEVIARAHYRGRVKRRMQRFVSQEACRLSPGDSGRLPDGRSFKVVRAARLADSRCDFLAVTSAAATAEAEPGTTAEPAAPPGAPPQQPILLARQLPLPYALPD